jgi:hypothetical protein
MNGWNVLLVYQYVCISKVCISRLRSSFGDFRFARRWYMWYVVIVVQLIIVLLATVSVLMTRHFLTRLTDWTHSTRLDSTRLDSTRLNSTNSIFARKLSLAGLLLPTNYVHIGSKAVLGDDPGRLLPSTRSSSTVLQRSSDDWMHFYGVVDL